jgi:hypothetical protein
MYCFTLMSNPIVDLILEAIFLQFLIDIRYLVFFSLLGMLFEVFLECPSNNRE